MRKTAKTILAVACFTGIILAGGENPDGSVNFIWTICWLAVAALSAFGYKKLEDVK